MYLTGFILKIISGLYLAAELLSQVWWAGTVTHSIATYYYFWALYLLLFFFTSARTRDIQSKFGLIAAFLLISIVAGFEIFEILYKMRPIEKIAGGTWVELFLGIAWFIYIWIALVHKDKAK